MGDVHDEPGGPGDLAAAKIEEGHVIGDKKGDKMASQNRWSTLKCLSI
jgi:hypothetical protein